MINNCPYNYNVYYYYYCYYCDIMHCLPVALFTVKDFTLTLIAFIQNSTRSMTNITEFGASIDGLANPLHSRESLWGKSHYFPVSLY